jgi:FkbM family methyltransferase
MRRIFGAIKRKSISLIVGALLRRRRLLDKLIALLSHDESALLRRVVAVYNSDALGRVLLSEDTRPFRKLSREHKRSVLRRLLWMEDWAISLKERLLENDARLLRTMLFAEDYAVAKRMMLERDARLLRTILFAEDYAVAKRMMLEKDATPLRNILLADDGAELNTLLKSDEVLGRVGANEKLAAAMEFHELWRRVEPHIRLEGTGIREKVKWLQTSLTYRGSPTRGIAGVLLDKGNAHLARGEMRMMEPYGLWVLMNELLLDEEYFFDAETDAPRILDCGTHVGMSIYYFKGLFPNARITGFEPVPEMREIALENVRRNGYSDVEVLPYALAEARKTARFYVSTTDSMAGSLGADFPYQQEAELREIEVECRPLSEFLDGPVHLLKMDIEGAEDVVLEEAGERLGNAQHIILEFHEPTCDASDRLLRVLSVLHRNGFVTHLGKTWSYRKASERRPMTHVGKRPYRAVIWARNTRWRSEDDRVSSSIEEGKR